MQAAGLIKNKTNEVDIQNLHGAKQVRPMAKPILVASVTRENSSVATLVQEAKDGVGWITTKIKVSDFSFKIN